MSKDVMKMSKETNITRSCGECSRFSSAGTCLESVEHRPNARVPRQCLGFLPVPEAYDDRTGRELWPELANYVEAGGGAKGFLAAALTAGPVPSAQIIIQAGAAGIPERSIQRAAEKLGVLRTKAGFKEGWKWALQNAEGAKE